MALEECGQPEALPALGGPAGGSRGEWVVCLRFPPPPVLSVRFPPGPIEKMSRIFFSPNDAGDDSLVFLLLI